MRILVTGSRELKSLKAVQNALAEVTAGHRGPHTVVHGNARGTDSLAAVAARRFGWQVEPHPADWNGPCRDTCKPGHRRPNKNGDGTFCPAAGDYRNQAMVDLGADLVVAFLLTGAANSGTRDCIRRAEAADLKVRKVEA